MVSIGFNKFTNSRFQNFTSDMLVIDWFEYVLPVGGMYKLTSARARSIRPKQARAQWLIKTTHIRSSNGIIAIMAMKEQDGMSNTHHSPPWLEEVRQHYASSHATVIWGYRNAIGRGHPLMPLNQWEKSRMVYGLSSALLLYPLSP